MVSWTRASMPAGCIEASPSPTAPPEVKHLNHTREGKREDRMVSMAVTTLSLGLAAAGWGRSGTRWWPSAASRRRLLACMLYRWCSSSRGSNSAAQPAATAPRAKSIGPIRII